MAVACWLLKCYFFVSRAVFIMKDVIAVLVLQVCHVLPVALFAPLYLKFHCV